MSERAVALPRLETGDRLDQAEFHRRYELRPDIRADLIGGVVYVASPMTYDLHDEQAALAVTWLRVYAAKHPALARSGANATLILGPADEVQPDAFLFVSGPGGPRINDEHYLVGAPQLVVEVAGSSVAKDVGPKKEAYRRAGVREYLVWRTAEGALDWFELREGDYVRREPDGNGVIESTVFPGLRLDVPAMLALDAAKVLAALD